MKTYFGMEYPPVNIAAFAIGNGVLGSEAVYFNLPSVRHTLAGVRSDTESSRTDYHLGDLSTVDRLQLRRVRILPRTVSALSNGAALSC